ncbi:S1C family serine protease, partial [uncultured Adlercreutzia sp.]
SVVAVDVYVDASASMGQFAGMSQQNQSQQGDESNLQAYSQGSGVVLSQDGYIITNNHVVEGGSAYKVTVGGETYDAELVGADPSSDVAVLKAKDAKNLTVMELGDSDDLTIGEWVMTLG